MLMINIRRQKKDREENTSQLFKSKKIFVQNVSGTWYKVGEGTDMIAFKLFLQIFHEYQKTGEISENIGIFY